MRLLLFHLCHGKVVAVIRALEIHAGRIHSTRKSSFFARRIFERLKGLPITHVKPEIIPFAGSPFDLDVLAACFGCALAPLIERDRTGLLLVPVNGGDIPRARNRGC